MIIFVDNDAARAAAVRGETKSFASARIVTELWELVAEHGMYPWVDRVASKANPADGPSRGDWSLMKEIGARRVQITELL